jgi:ribosomal-protein-alanine N-acetyltransferase
MSISSELPSLETERLLLRPLSMLDLEFVFRHFSDPEVNRYLLDEEPVTTREQAQSIIDFYSLPGRKSYNRWVIVRKTDARPIGTCGYHQWQSAQRRAEIGYDLEKASWRQGIMTEALHAMLRYGFEQMGLNRVEALVYVENHASIRLLERLGFKKEGLLRQYFRRDDTYFDHWLLSLLRADWTAG